MVLTEKAVWFIVICGSFMILLVYVLDIFGLETRIRIREIRKFIKSFSYEKIEQIIDGYPGIYFDDILNAFCLDSVKQQDYIYYDKLADYLYSIASFKEDEDNDRYYTSMRLFNRSRDDYEWGYKSLYSEPLTLYFMVRHNMEKKGKQMLSYSDFFVYVYKRKYKSREDREDLRQECGCTWKERLHILNNLEKECKKLC